MAPTSRLDHPAVPGMENYSEASAAAARPAPQDHDRDDPGFTRRKMFLSLFAMAMALRLIFLFSMARQIDLSDALLLGPDEALYMQAAGAIASGFDFDSNGVVLFGPGYPMVLAIPMLIFGAEPVIILLMQCLLSALATIMLAAFAHRLTGNVYIGLVAGFIHAVSLTAITTAAAPLTEPLFMVLLLGSLLYFWRGLESEKAEPFIWSGVLLSLATLTRGVSVLFFAILLLAARLHFAPFRRESIDAFFSRFKKALLILPILLVIVGGWTLRNHVQYGFTSTSLAGSVGLSTLSCLVQGDRDDEATLACLERARYRAQGHAGDSLTPPASYAQVAAAGFFNLLNDRPGALIGTYLLNVNVNMHTESQRWERQLPDAEPTLARFALAIDRYGLDYRVTVLVLISLIVMIVRRQYQLAVILAAIWLYFGLLSGLTLWQGSRVFYPGQVAWSIMLAYLGVAIWDRIAHRRHARHHALSG